MKEDSRRYAQPTEARIRALEEKIAEQEKKINELDEALNIRAELADNYKCKPFFHELPQSTIDQMIKDGKTLQYVMDNYSQPEWCKYPNALDGKMGCWSLVCMRTDISREFCEDCDCYNK